jgi:hypothetical protein
MVVLTNGGQLGSRKSFCFYCGRTVQHWKNVPFVDPPKDTRTADHVTPKHMGGTKLVTSCLGCNRDKKDLSLDEFRLIRAFRSGLVKLPEYKFAAERLPA